MRIMCIMLNLKAVGGFAWRSCLEVLLQCHDTVPFAERPAVLSNTRCSIALALLMESDGLIVSNRLTA